MKNLTQVQCLVFCLFGVAQLWGQAQPTPAPAPAAPAAPPAAPVAAPAAAPAPAEAAKPEKAPWTAQEFRLIDRPDEIVAVLENGMTVIIRENHTAPVAAARLYVRAGSIYEQEYLGAGMSHLFEHLLAGGATKTRTEQQSRELIEKIGARYNAFTSKDRTRYFLTVPAQHVGTALNLLADWVTRPTFPEEAFNREWGVVQRELEMSASDPDHQEQYIFDELRYKVHPARFPIIGYQAVVQQLTRQQILDYYQRMYVPDNTVVVVVGNINAAEMLDAVKKEFADFRRRPIGNIVLPAEPDVSAPREVVKVCPTMQGPARMTVGFPSFKLQDADLYALDTLANIMGQGQSSRLYRRLREERQLVLAIDASNYTPSYAAGTFSIMCELNGANVTATRTAIWEEINRIKKEAVTAEELARAKRQLAVGHVRAHQTAEQQAATMADDYLATGDPHFSDHYVENMQQVTPEQVQAMARKYLLAEKQLTLILTPTALTEQQAQGPKKADGSAIRKITLDNGLRVLLRHNPAVPLVNIQLYVVGGLMDETDPNNGLTNLMTQLSIKGTTHYTAQQIVDYFDGIGGALSAGCGNNTFYYRAEVMPQDLTKAFDIYREIVLEPNFPDAELAKLKPQILAAIQQVKNSWPAEARRVFQRDFFANSPYRRQSLGTESSVAAITREQIRAFHREAAVAQRAILAIFGDIDADAVEKMVRERFAAMPAGTAYNLERFAPEPAITAPRQFVEKTAKPGATVYVGFPGMKITNVQDRYPMEVMTEVIGSNTGWLHELLRGRQLVYYAWGFSAPGLLPGYVAATAQCEADKAPEVLRLIQEQLAKAARGEFTEAEVNHAKSNQINAEILEKQTNADAATTAALDELYGFGFNWSDGYTDRIMAVTLADVQNVAKKYLSASPTVSIVTSAPESFAPAGAK